jgi:uncharacterized surface protein with fasciclin (FAS1) repeats
MRRVFAGLLASLIALPLAISLAAAPVAAADGDIVQVAVSTPALSTLVTALQCDQSAGFVAALESPGPFTVFAPTNTAFAKLGLTSANVCTALPLKTLDSILEYHVLAGQALTAAQIYTHPGFERPLKMLDGKYSFPTLFGGTPRIDFAKVIEPNVMASNGVVHVIDSVLLPY